MRFQASGADESWRYVNASLMGRSSVGTTVVRKRRAREGLGVLRAGCWVLRPETND